MLLTPTEMERLVIFTAAELARKRRARGVKLNHPEAVAFIADEILEGARDGRSVADLISFGATLLTTDDVLPGVMDLMPMIQVEATFPDGTKLVTLHHPIAAEHGQLELALYGSFLPTPDLAVFTESADDVRPGAYEVKPGEIVLNDGRDAIELPVTNLGDRPIQVGSHYHFIETNASLKFDRGAAYGRRLDIPAGTAVRFEPGQTRDVQLVPFAGKREVYGFRQEVMGKL